MNLTRKIWRDCGSRQPAKAIRQVLGTCYWCGLECCGSGVRVADVCGKMFSDHEFAASKSSDNVCIPCAWVMTGKPPDTVRMWSVVYREDREAAPSNPKAIHTRTGPHTHLCSKADLSQVVDTLLDPPDSTWGVSIADSGQIHVLPQAQVNTGRLWTVQFERAKIHASSDQLSTLIHHCAVLYGAGFVKDDISSGSPHPSKLVKYGLDVWRDNDEVLRPHRGGALMDLALFLLRTENRDDLRDRTSAFRRPPIHSRSWVCPSSHAQREHRQDPTAGLVAPSSSSTRNSGRVEGLAEDGQPSGGQATDRNPSPRLGQRSLFD